MTMRAIILSISVIGRHYHGHRLTCVHPFVQLHLSQKMFSSVKLIGLDLSVILHDYTI